MDSTFSTNFTFANGAEEWSLDMITIPMFLGGVVGNLSLTGLDQPGPALLGMRSMHGIGRGIDLQTGQHA